jgi:hypothetical protein
MQDPVILERERCVGVCRRRAELWRKTSARNPVASELEEARARANEADYLADLLERGEDIAVIHVSGGDESDA